MKKIFLISLTATALFSSCDPGSTVFFEIYNSTNKDITVEYKQDNIDSVATVIILPKRKRQILCSDHFLGYVDRVEKTDKIGIHELKIKRDALSDTTNYNIKKYWEYFKISDTEGWFRLTIK